MLSCFPQCFSSHFHNQSPPFFQNTCVFLLLITMKSILVAIIVAMPLVTVAGTSTLIHIPPYIPGSYRTTHPTADRVCIPINTIACGMCPDEFCMDVPGKFEVCPYEHCVDQCTAGAMTGSCNPMNGCDPGLGCSLGKFAVPCWIYLGE